MNQSSFKNIWDILIRVLDAQAFVGVSYPNFVRGLLFDDIQPLIGRFKILGTLCCTICEAPRRAENQKEAGLRDP